jgi:hypothetical protein
MTESISSLEKPGVLANIFKLTEYVVPEDRFTAAWGYVLNREPVLAQAVADIILKDRGQVAKVIRVTDHPDCNSLKKPDFCIACEGLDILVEHKLDALLHENQLENYLGLQIPRTTYVAFIAPAYQAVPEQVLRHPLYLKPKGRDHFKWCDFHGAVKSQPGWLTQEFADYMTSLGMAPFTLKGAEDIFDTRVKPVQFDEAMKVAARQIFARDDNPGCWFKGTQTGRGHEVRTPSASLTLIYIWAEQRSNYVPGYDGPVLAVNVFEREIAGPCRLTEATIKTPSGLAVRRHNIAKPIQQGEGKCRITYVAPLIEIIRETRDATVRRMAEMLTVVRTDHWLDN